MKSVLMVVLAIAMMSTSVMADMGDPCTYDLDCNIGAKCVMQDVLGRGVCSRDPLGN